jgi:phage tail sheath protein FI
MPEYLSPGVYIQEIPSALKAIEGVSTSTAGFVGEAGRGPVPGWTPIVDPLVAMTPDDAPVLVTSFADYQRTFGPPNPNPSPTTGGYLGYAVRAFFDNGGKRAFVVRAVVPDPDPAGGTPAAAAFHEVDQGSAARLTRNVKTGATVIYLNSLRGIDLAGSSITISSVDGTAIVSAVAPTAYDTAAGSVTIPALSVDIDASKSFVTVSTITTSAGTGPRFWARNPGSWGAALRFLIANADRPPVKVVAAVGGGGSTLVQVQNVASFYVGAIVSIDHGPTGTAHPRDVRTVVDILPGNTLQLDSAVSDVLIETAGVPGGYVQVNEIDVQIVDTGTGAAETFRGMTWNPDANPNIRARHYATIINTRSSLAWVEPPWSTALAGTEDTSLATQPATAQGFAVAPTGATEQGGDGVAADRSHIIGEDLGPGHRSGIQSLKDVEDVRINAAPGETNIQVQAELVTQCELMRYRFAVLDSEDSPATPVVNELLKHRNNFDSSFAAFYAPWVQIEAPGNKILNLPPSGYAMGIYARVDNARGVWKAPANEPLNSVVGLTAYITTGEQDLLNPRGVDCIRRFEGRGIRVWGARTLSSDPDFKYINVRRFLIFMEASLDRGTQWVVFEPNSPDTWSRVVDSVAAFLNTQWREGALFGRKAEDAYFVRCDETTMSADDILNGRLICHIGVAIVRPAEFVIFRIEQITALGAKN